MDISQLHRCDRNWVIALIFMGITFVINITLHVFRILTISSISKQKTFGGHRFVLADYFTFVSFVSVLRKKAFSTVR